METEYIAALHSGGSASMDLVRVGVTEGTNGHWRLTYFRLEWHVSLLAFGFMPFSERDELHDVSLSFSFGVQFRLRPFIISKFSGCS